MKLVVLAGAKEGAEIPLKKDKFVIGRAKDCTLRAGSDAISRHHCALMKSAEGISVRDLGSRNGTYVNEEKIAGETLLKDGDNLRVGTLEFRFDAAQAKSKKAEKAAAPAAATAVGQDIDRSKKPKVKNVADAVSRAGNTDHESDEIEDDISRWLLGPDPSDSAASRETQSFRIDETKTLASPPKDAAEAEAETDPEAEVAEDGEATETAQGKKPKKVYGKLPPVPKNMANDSREAAENILREMTRRR